MAPLVKLAQRPVIPLKILAAHVGILGTDASQSLAIRQKVLEGARLIFANAWLMTGFHRLGRNRVTNALIHVFPLMNLTLAQPLALMGR